MAEETSKSKRATVDWRQLVIPFIVLVFVLVSTEAVSQWFPLEVHSRARALLIASVLLPLVGLAAAVLRGFREQRRHALPTDPDKVTFGDFDVLIDALIEARTKLISQPVWDIAFIGGGVICAGAAGLILL